MSLCSSSFQSLRFSHQIVTTETTNQKEVTFSHDEARQEDCSLWCIFNSRACKCSDQSMEWMSADLPAEKTKDASVDGNVRVAGILVTLLHSRHKGRSDSPKDSDACSEIRSVRAANVCATI